MNLKVSIQITIFGSKQLISQIFLMKNSKQPVVAMTGFVHDPLMETYKQMLKEIGCKYVDQLSMDVDYLIVNHTCTEKYKISELHNSRIQSITLPWLQDSHKNKKILGIEKYKVNKIFYGVKVILEGFQDKKTQQKIIQILKNNGVQEIKQTLNGVKTQQFEELLEKYQLMIIPSVKLYKKLELNLSELLMIPIVTHEWLEQSIKSKKCKYPNDYALNYHSINHGSFDDTINIRRLNRKIQYYMELDFLNTNSSALLCDDKTGEQLIIYLDGNSIQKNFIDILQRLICLNGGLYLNTYGPVVTHILVGAVEQSQYYKFMNYGDSSHIVRVEWLIDSILCSEKLPQIDFKIRSFKQPLTKSHNNLEIKQTFHHKYQQNSQTLFQSMNKFNSNNFASMPIAPIKMSVSVSREEPKPAKVIAVTKLKTKSQIFKKKLFFLQKSQRKQSVMFSVYNKIKQNGGLVFNETNVTSLKNTKIFIVLRDSDKNAQYLEETHKLIGSRGIETIPVSIRWIEQCIKKGQIIEHNSDNHFIFKPFSFQTPLRQLMTMKIQLLGIEEILKRRYKELLIALGTNKISPNMAEITHCLCGSDYQTDQRYLAIAHALGQKQKQKEQKQKETASKQGSGSKVMGLSNIKFVKIEWLLQLVNNKGKTNIQQFLMPNDQIPM